MDDVFVGMPALGAKKVPSPLAAGGRAKKGSVRKLSVADAEKAYLRAAVGGDKYVQVPDGATGEGACDEPNASPYGTRNAERRWGEVRRGAARSRRRC